MAVDHDSASGVTLLGVKWLLVVVITTVVKCRSTLEGGLVKSGQECVQAKTCWKYTKCC